MTTANISKMENLKQFTRGLNGDLESLETIIKNASCEYKPCSCVYQINLLRTGQYYLADMQELLHGKRSCLLVARSLLELSSKIWYLTKNSLTTEERKKRYQGIEHSYIEKSLQNLTRGSSIYKLAEPQKLQERLDELQKTNDLTVKPRDIELVKQYSKENPNFLNGEPVINFYAYCSSWAHGNLGIVNDLPEGDDFIDLVQTPALHSFFIACIEMSKLYEFNFSQEISDQASELGFTTLEGQ